MAAAEGTSEMTVLRIKRKRTDDPLNALVVHNADMKKTKMQVGDNPTDSNSVFRYSGTVDCTQIDTSKNVVKKFQAIYQQVVRHAGEAERDKGKRREMHKAHQKFSRYRIISEKRPDADNSDEHPSLEESEMEQLYKIYDVVAEVENQNQSTSAKTDSLLKDETILCNNVEMLREKLHIGENVPTKTDNKDEFVYDLYLAPGGAIVMAENEIINVEEYHKDEYELVFNNGGYPDECYEDEDDENDEDNWRNEYPEDESHSSEEDYGGHPESYHGSSSEDEDYVYSRYRHGNARLQFDPYAASLSEDYYYTVADDDPDET